VPLETKYKIQTKTSITGSRTSLTGCMHFYGHAHPSYAYIDFQMSLTYWVKFKPKFYAQILPMHSLFPMRKANKALSTCKGHIVLLEEVVTQSHTKWKLSYGKYYTTLYNACKYITCMLVFIILNEFLGMPCSTVEEMDNAYTFFFKDHINWLSTFSYMQLNPIISLKHATY
jgi:hypothetical protein